MAHLCRVCKRNVCTCRGDVADKVTSLPPKNQCDGCTDCQSEEKEE